MMKLSDFDFILPPDLIAAFPPQDRPSARLLFAGKKNADFSHHTFREIGNFLKPGDLLVLNDTKVRPARIFGKKESGGSVEALLLKEGVPGEWEALLRPGGRIKKGMTLIFGDAETILEAEVLDEAVPDSGQRHIKFWDRQFREKLAKIGHIPLPPYLDRPDAEIDREMYQTVYARNEGAAASPTAGLHFDKPLLDALEKQGVEIVYVTLHTSYGTFQPVTEEDLTKHKMFFEDYEITPHAADQINRAIQEKRRVIACGTTSVRTLEAAAGRQSGGQETGDEGKEEKRMKGELSGVLLPPVSRPLSLVHPGSGSTNLFIYPGYEFKIVSGMITNFHLPKSSLLLLVAALLGRERLFEAYREAIRQNYRFYSYGDAMLIF